MAKAGTSNATHLKRFELTQKYEAKAAFSESEINWMAKHDWHPVDEREIKEEVIKELQKPAKSKKITIKELLYG
ncbi:hypothetical protein COV61_02275 [Candidatus Micrarchaeota archaeon CG11_big_fil_rev_8_21_14_0_20_47_5]|nr:MAG: hypothetical protein AUJ17_04155 [Candidatus Micrarchaeota archaeon CG1_02_47_40]PIN83734.1 MAG: hypothetical protein COV61_02275 [Candidatus Micrarchaeota archaeon CG11_big_fil_rev_8_21_14_0_20_47_5]QBM01429.1 hypothetical protein [uncultured archaeon]